MKQWEYKNFSFRESNSLKVDDCLFHIGMDGWEVYQVSTEKYLVDDTYEKEIIVYCKREYLEKKYDY